MEIGRLPHVSVQTNQQFFKSLPEPSDQASNGRSSFSNSAFSYTLSREDIYSLLEAVGKLPEPGSLPYERQIIISGIRSNEWFLSNL